MAFLNKSAKYSVILYLFVIIGATYGHGYNGTKRDNPEERGGHLQGDILVHHGLHSRNGLLDERYRWAGKELPFVIARGYTDEEVNMIYEAAAIINENSCVFIRPKKRGDINYVEIKDRNQGCSSFIGCLNQGKQDMSLDPNCFAKIGTIIHEFLHCLGFIHQHSSPERDEFITINWDNIDKEYYNNFDAYTEGPVTDFGVPYDPFSVMHYSEYAFSTNQDKTIDLRDGLLDVEAERSIGQREGLTNSDIEKLNAMYECY